MDLSLQITVLTVAGLISALLIGLGAFLGTRDGNPEQKEANKVLAGLFGFAGVGLLIFAIVVATGWKPPR
jgi:hypothetical protein